MQCWEVDRQILQKHVPAHRMRKLPASESIYFKLDITPRMICPDAERKNFTKSALHMQCLGTGTRRRAQWLNSAPSGHYINFFSALPDSRSSTSSPLSITKTDSEFRHVAGSLVTSIVTRGIRLLALFKDIRHQPMFFGELSRKP